MICNIFWVSVSLPAFPSFESDVENNQELFNFHKMGEVHVINVQYNELCF